MWHSIALGVHLSIASLFFVPTLAAESAPAADAVVVVEIDRIGHARLDALKATPGLRWWVELDDLLLAKVEESRVSTLSAGASLRVLDDPGSPDTLYFLRTGHHDVIEDLESAATLAAGGAWAVVSTADAAELQEHLSADGHQGCAKHSGLFPLLPDTVLARQAANEPPRERTAFGSGVQALVDLVDADRWLADVTTLAGYNRWTRGTDILNARDWLVTQFQTMPGLTVTTESFPVGGDTGFNVIATLAGTSRPDDWYIVGAHYDSISQSSASAAPGAEDNASGCAGVLQLARIFTQFPPEGTVFFICYAGEEQGLFGSHDHAGDLVTSGNASKIQEVLIMDMIGYTRDADLDSLLESNAASQGMINAFADAAAQYTSLRIVTSLNPFGSDHVPYLSRGMTALLVIENDWNQYAGYHRTTDLPANLDLGMGGETLKMNVAAMAQLIGAGGPIAVFADGFESGDFTGWAGISP